MIRPDRRTAITSAALAALATLSGCDTPAAPAPVAPAPVGPVPVAESPRARAIRESAEVIRGECLRNAGGDWAKWMEKTAPYRDALRDRAMATIPFNPKAGGNYFEGRDSVLAATDDFPLVECAPRSYLRYMTEPALLGKTNVVGAITAAHRWLQKRGVDLVFALAPKMVEVYPDHFAAPCPADRLVNPHMRRLLLDLLEADVEVLDLLPVLLAARDPSPEPLYLAADPHWGPKGYNAAARVTATRLARYPFAVAAKAGPPVVKAVKTSFPPLTDGIAHVAAGLMALNPAQRQRATEAHPKTYDVVTGLDGGWPQSHTSSVIVIGDSYGIYYDGALSRDLNLVLDRRASGGQTTEAFADFLREPESLAAGKVVVWIASTPQLLGFKPLPAPILAAAGA